MSNDFTVDYFIKKIEAIPEDKWCEGVLYKDNKCCASGHCGLKKEEVNDDGQLISTDNNEFLSLARLLISVTKHYDLYEAVWNLNDGFVSKYDQNHPKQRVLSALYNIKNSQLPKEKEIIKYIAVDAPIRKQAQKTLVNEINN